MLSQQSVEVSLWQKTLRGNDDNTVIINSVIALDSHSRHCNSQLQTPSVLTTYRFPNIFRPIRCYSNIRILVQIFPQVLQNRTECRSDLGRRNISSVVRKRLRTDPVRRMVLNMVADLTFLPVLMFITLTFSLPVRGLSALLLLFLLVLFTRSCKNTTKNNNTKVKCEVVMQAVLFYLPNSR